MKTLIKINTLALIVLLSAAMFVASCKKDSTSTPVDYKSLDSLIVVATALSGSATTADYPQAAITSYNTTLTSVKTARATNPDQTATNNLNTQLGEAIKTFKSQAYGFIDESLYLNAGWHFDEGSGTTATAFSTVKHVGTFKAGNAILGSAASTAPTWVAGVKGGSALHFSGGSHLEVPYTTAFLPVDLSVSVWVKPDELYENNYIISQNFWNGYKLQLQHEGKPFFTYNTTKATNSIIDADNETVNSVKINVWNHIVITVNGTTKELKFFNNGVLTKTWTEATKGIAPLIRTLSAPVAQPFIIGGVATDAELATTDFSAWLSATNLGYFIGSIDELKIYNTALTDGQVAKLYNDEKP